MTKTRKILIIVLFSILGLLIVVASVLAVYAVSLYNKMDYDPEATFAPSVEVNDAFLQAYDKINEGIPIEEVIKDPNLTAEQIEILKQYADEVASDISDYIATGSGTQTPETTIQVPVIEPPTTSQSAGVINLLFLGTDERPGESQTRSDSMIVVSINTETKEITFTSLMRDMYIEIVGLGRYNKLNAAYRFGGVKMLSDTIDTYLGMKIDNYVRVTFESFQTVIDEIGGVDVPFSDLSAARKEEIKRLKKYTDFSENQLVPGTVGTYHLTGEQALYFCRDRYSGNTVEGAPDGDFGRTERQRKVLSAIVKKAQSMSFTDLMAAMPEILSIVTTDLTIGDCTELLTSVATTYSQYTIRTYRIPADNTWEYDTKSVGSVLTVDYSENAKLWKEFIYGK